MATLGRSDDKDFERVVFQEELDYQANRRARWSDGREVRNEAGLTVEQELVGLAFSGGGIRSATFNLGVSQALHRRGLWGAVDYLSTVSGGGYVGAALSSWLRSPPANADDPFPFPIERTSSEPPLLAYIRNHANYLTPAGLVSVAQVLSVLFRGITLNLMVFAPLLVVASMAIAAVYGPGLRAGVPATSMMLAVPSSVGISLAAILLYPLLSMAYRVLWVANPKSRAVLGIDVRDRTDLVYTGFFAVFLGAVVLDLQPLVLERFRAWDPAESGSLVPEGAAVLSGAAVSTLTALGVFRARVLRRPLLLLGGLLAGLLGPYLAFILLTEYLVHPETVLADALQPVELLGALLVPDSIELDEPYLRMVGVGVLALSLTLVSSFLVDVNTTGMSSFYRDRLARVFVIRADADSLGPDEDLPLSRLCPDDSGSPYHLINTALNLQASQDPDLRGRNADFFVLSPRFAGGRRAGWCRTEELEAVSPWMHLGTAMATSGAAAAPNMGTFTTGPLVPLLVLLNIRTGVWVPSPRVVHDGALVRREPGAPRPTPDRPRLPFRAPGRLLLREMSGSMHERSKALYLSDGGHLENLGAYELLRRRCKLVIVGDGEADPTLSMQALATLARYARIDMGVEIDVDVSPLRLEDGLSEAHTLVGRIRYPDDGQGEEIGWLLYCKSSVTGDEELVVDHYRRGWPDFPHETTADQFFDEKQFEAYRSLGVHAMESFFGGVGVTEAAEPWDLRRLLAEIAERWERDHGGQGLRGGVASESEVAGA